MLMARHLSLQAIEEFKTAYHDEFGTILTDDEVREIALNLLHFFGMLRTCSEQSEE